MSKPEAVAPQELKERQRGQVSSTDLPARDTTRWVANRKAAVVEAVNEGRLSVHEACERYDLTPQELTMWQNAVEREGAAGLRMKSRSNFVRVNRR